MDEVIAEYAAKLQKIYDERTAGDHTFAGVLAEFSRVSDGVKFQEFVKQYVNSEKEWPIPRLKTRSHPCRCGNYAGDSAADLDEHVMAMMHVEDGTHHG